MFPCRTLAFCLVLLNMWVDKALCAETAFVEVIIYEHSGGDYTTQTYELKGTFSVAGAATSAEGDIEQVHPLGLCNTSDDGKWKKYGWVGIVKLTVPDRDNRPCFTLFEKAKRAIQRGATAIIFDITDDPDAASQLNAAENKITRPVIIIDGQDAEKLIKVANNQKASARARIQYTTAGYTPQRAANEYFDMIIFMTFFIVVSVVCFILLLKIKWKQKQKESSLTRMALHAISRMETRKYLPPSESSILSEDAGELSDTSSTGSLRPAPSMKCVICLEKFQEGQDVRIVPCRHEFHKSCVDPWLLSNYTCPLCMLNIVEREHTKNKRRQRGWLAARCTRCLSSNSLSSLDSSGSIVQNVLSPSRDHSTVNIHINDAESVDVTTSSSSLPRESLENVAHCQVSNDGDNDSILDTQDCVRDVGCNRPSSSKSNYSSRTSLNRHSLDQSSRSSGSSATLHRDYTHQVVVVAPITADMMDASQEDIV